MCAVGVHDVHPLAAVGAGMDDRDFASVGDQTGSPVTPMCWHGLVTVG